MLTPHEKMMAGRRQKIYGNAAVRKQLKQQKVAVGSARDSAAALEAHPLEYATELESRGLPRDRVLLPLHEARRLFEEGSEDGGGIKEKKEVKNIVSGL